MRRLFYRIELIRQNPAGTDIVAWHAVQPNFDEFPFRPKVSNESVQSDLPEKRYRHKFDTATERVAFLTFGDTNMLRPNGSRLDDESFTELTFTINTLLHQDSGDGDNYLHEIDGKISIRDVDEREEAAGTLRAYLVQFSEAQAQGIASRSIGDGNGREIGHYWGELFGLDEEGFKTEIQDHWQTEGTDLLIIASIQIVPKFGGQGIGAAALARTIDLFGRNTDLVACYPQGIEEFSDQEPGFVQETNERENAIVSLRDDCVKIGFRAWDKSGIYLFNPCMARQNVLLE